MGQNKKGKRMAAEAELRSPFPSPSRVSPTPAAEMNLKEHLDARFNEMRALWEAGIEELKAANAAKDAIIEKLTEQLTLCQARVERLDQQYRACNMIIYSMPETEDPAEAI